MAGQMEPMEQTASARLSVDLEALVANYRTLRDRCAPSTCGAVVKADAYGLGVDPVVEALVDAGCGEFFVATLAEGEQVRSLAADVDVYVFAGADKESASAMSAARLIPMLNSAAQMQAWRRVGGPTALHFDTGMARLGIDWADYDPALSTGLDVVLLATHLACADEPGHKLNQIQLQRFATIAAEFPGVKTSIGNSAATLTGGSICGDLARPGIALYGGNPFAGQSNPMRSVLTLEGRILQTRTVAAGATVGYGATHAAERTGRLAIVGVGYADGLPRAVSNRGAVAVAGQRAPIVGRVSMDLTIVDVTDVGPPPRAGEWVEFLGPHIGIDECAAWADTIGYEILTGLGRRPTRRYLGPAIATD